MTRPNASNPTVTHTNAWSIACTVAGRVVEDARDPPIQRPKVEAIAFTIAPPGPHRLRPQRRALLRETLARDVRSCGTCRNLRTRGTSTRRRLRARVATRASPLLPS